MSVPLLSICIPTRNRADMLDYCLSKLGGLADFGIDFEVVISDNSQTNDSAKVVEKHTDSIERLVYCHQPNERDVPVGYLNSVRNSKGRFVTYLADDDSLIFEPLVRYLRKLETNPRMAAIAADWIAYDDEEERELHRNFRFREPVAFEPEDPLGLVNFLVGNCVYPDFHIIRRESLLASDCIGARFRYGALRWIYRVARFGTVAFELEPFYRENRRVKSRFDLPPHGRQDTDNYRMRLQFIGDEARMELEVLYLWAAQDSGLTHMPPDQIPAAKNMIDIFLNTRIPLEVERAIATRNWLLALDLRRRYILWYGPGDESERRRDAMSIALPAALQAVRDACVNLSGAAGLRLIGFSTPFVADHFRAVYPEIKLVDSAVENSSGGRTVVLVKSAESGIHLPAFDGYCFALDQLSKQYSLGTSIDLEIL